MTAQVGQSPVEADFEAALRTVTYTDTSDTPSTLQRTVTFTVKDPDGGSDTTIRTAQISVTPLNDAPTISAPASVTVTEDVASPVTGISFAVLDAGSASVQATFTVASGTLLATSSGNVTVGGTANALTLTGSLADIDGFIAGSNLTYQTALNSDADVTLGVTINDLGNSPAPAQQTSTAVTMHVTPVNDAPDLTLNVTTVAASEQIPVALAPALTLTDVDSTTLSSATVKISTNYIDGEDLLSFTDTALIQGQFDHTSGTLTLTAQAGQSPVEADFEAALRTVTYTDTSDTPSTLQRTVTFTVKDPDGGSDTTIRTAQISVTPLNDAPTISAPASVTVTEDVASPVTGISFADLDAGSASVQATFTVASGTLLATSSGNVTVGGTANALTLTGSLADIDGFIAGSNLTYQTALNSDADVTLGVTINDLGNSPAPAQQTSTAVTMHVTPVNDAPDLTLNVTTVAASEQIPVALAPTLTLTDVDSTTLSSATVKISTNYIDGEDLLSFTDTALIQGQFDHTSGTLTLTAQAGQSPVEADFEAALRTVTYTDTSDTPSTLQRTVTFTVKDPDGGSDTTIRTAQISVTPLNDAPMLSGVQPSDAFTPGGPAVRLSRSLSVTDVDNTTLAGATVRVSGGTFLGDGDVLSVNGLTNGLIRRNQYHRGLQRRHRDPEPDRHRYAGQLSTGARSPRLPVDQFQSDQFGPRHQPHHHLAAR